MTSHAPRNGNFEGLARAYHDGRKGFDERVFTYLNELVGGLSGRNLLDVGCGTGIATRQLALYGTRVTGSDISEEMVTEARRADPNGHYVVAPAHQLPFNNKSFDVVTAFSAFHWFATEDAVMEIRRVLAVGGTFAVVNKNDIAGIRVEAGRLFTKYPKQRGKQDYDPENLLKQARLVSVFKKTFTTKEIFSFREAFAYLQSLAFWNVVPEHEKEVMRERVRTLCENIEEQNGTLDRTIETVVVVGTK